MNHARDVIKNIISFMACTLPAFPSTCAFQIATVTILQKYYISVFESDRLKDLHHMKFIICALRKSQNELNGDTSRKTSEVVVSVLVLKCMVLDDCKSHTWNSEHCQCSKIRG